LAKGKASSKTQVRIKANLTVCNKVKGKTILHRTVLLGPASVATLHTQLNPEKFVPEST